MTTANDELNLDGMSSGGNFREIKRFKVTEGSHVYRILPPFGTNHDRKASRQIQLHWGYKTADGKARPLVCSYTTEGACPICEWVKGQEALAKSYGVDSKGNPSTDEGKAIMKESGECKVRRSFLLNAVNKAGEVGVLEIPKMAHDQLIEMMREYLTKYGKNPTSLKDGVWFEFSRTGKGFNTEYKVTTCKTLVTLEDGDQVEKVDRSPIALNVQENFEKLAYDIHAMYKPMKGADLNRVLEGEPIDAVFKREQKKQDEPAAAEPVSEVKAKPAAEKKAAPAAKKETKPKPSAAPAPAADDGEDDWMAALNAE